MPLWDLSQAIDPALLQRTWQKNFTSAMDALADQFRALASATPPKS